MEELELITALIYGEESAFKQLVHSCQDKVYNTCLHFVRDQGQAEDIAQEVFIEIYKSISNFRKDAKLNTWIYKITTSKCLEHQRYKKRKKRMAFFQSILGVEASTEYLEQKSIEYIHPGIQLERKEQSEKLFKAIDSLPNQQKVAFTLHNIDGLSYKEIADILEKSVSSVESLIFRAKKNLRKKLSNFYKNEM